MRKFPSKKLWHALKFLPLVGEGHSWAMNPSQAAPSSPLPIRAHLACATCGGALRQGLQQVPWGAALPAGVLWGKWKGHEEATNCVCSPQASLWASAPSSVKRGGTVSKVLSESLTGLEGHAGPWRGTQGTAGREEPYVCIFSGGRGECVALGLPSISPPLPGMAELWRGRKATDPSRGACGPAHLGMSLPSSPRKSIMRASLPSPIAPPRSDF